MMISPWRNKRKCLYVDNVELHFEYLTKECTQIYRPFLTNIKLLEACPEWAQILNGQLNNYILITLTWF